MDLGADGVFAAWVRPHWPAMSRLALRLSSPGEWEDILQETLSVAWRKRARYDPELGSARNWLLALTADQARKARRRSARLSLVALGSSGGPTRDAEAGMDLDRALDRLSPRQRLAVELYYFIGLPVNEVAAVMSCAPGTVKSTLSDARSRLRHELGENRDG